GIFWVLRSGAPWRDLPEVYGPRTTCYNRFVRWRRAGVWDRIMDALAAGHDAAVQMSRATTLVSVNQQLAISAGVAVGAFSVETTMLVHHVSELSAADFAPAFIVVAIISAISAYFFYQMPDDAGHEISGRKAVEISSRKAVEISSRKGAAKAASEGTEDARDQRLG
ncbi:MAG: hypothetical protein QOH32_4775, partial [Bradyrhizobium sp.]|nr:hypothetical protein [Bradyrhizobium sp.]